MKIRVWTLIAFMHTFAFVPDVKAGHDVCQKIHEAAFMDEPGDLTDLIGYGVNLDCRDIINQTPLLTAIEGASLDVVRILLSRGVNINARDEYGDTALAKAKGKLAFFDVSGGETYSTIYQNMIDLLENAGAVE